MALELVYGANFRRVLHHFSSLTRLKGSWGQLWPKTGPKQQNTKTKIIIFPRGLTATKFDRAKFYRLYETGESQKAPH